MSFYYVLATVCGTLHISFEIITTILSDRLIAPHFYAEEARSLGVRTRPTASRALTARRRGPRAVRIGHPMRLGPGGPEKQLFIFSPRKRPRILSFHPASPLCPPEAYEQPSHRETPVTLILCLRDTGPALPGGTSLWAGYHCRPSD